MAVTTEQIKELRDLTGVSVMQCKNALEEAEGDMEKALLILKQKASNVAMKKSDREAKDGLIVVKNDNKKACMLVLNCETDFVAKNEDFVKLAESLADMAFEKGVENTKKESEEMINGVVQKVGEKIEIGDIKEISGEVVGSYVHNGKKAVVVSLSGGTEEIARDVAMHIAAMNPSFVSKEEIDEEIKSKAKEIFQKEVDESDKPAEIKEKMLAGKLDTYFKEQTLIDQSFVKDPSLTVGDLLAKNNAKVVEFTMESI